MTQSDSMKGALQILELALSALVDAATPGITPRQIADLAQRALVAQHCRPVLLHQFNDAGRRFAFAACICVNDTVANAIPTEIPLAPGDLVTLDVALAWSPHSAAPVTVVDGASSCLVPGSAQPVATRLRDAARAATRACLDAAQPGVTPAILRDVARTSARARGVALAPIPLVHRVKQGSIALHLPFHVPIPEHMPLQPGDVVAIEPLILARDTEVDLDHDGFTLRTRGGVLGAYEECTMVVGDDEAIPRIVAPGLIRPWLFA